MRGLSFEIDLESLCRNQRKGFRFIKVAIIAAMPLQIWAVRFGLASFATQRFDMSLGRYTGTAP